MSGQPTPRPWDVLGPITKAPDSEPFFVVYAEDVQIVRLKLEANARFIVQACNSHDELLEAANRVLHEIFMNSGAPDIEARTTEALSRLAEAAAKAEGRQ